jgi:hypothetical protein
VGGWFIGEPIISFDNFELRLEYQVPDSVDNDTPSFKLFLDGQCSRDFTENSFLDSELIFDDTPLGSGDNFRNITVQLQIQREEIVRSEIITFVDGIDRAIVSFCVGVSLIDRVTNPARPAVIDSLNTQITVAVAFENDFGITELVDDDNPIYGVDAYECNATFHRVVNIQPKSQGSTVRICIIPSVVTLNDGLYLKSVDSFGYFFGGVQQEAVAKGIEANELTTIECREGRTLCWIESQLKNDFFFS